MIIPVARRVCFRNGCVCPSLLRRRHKFWPYRIGDGLLQKFFNGIFEAVADLPSVDVIKGGHLLWSTAAPDGNIDSHIQHPAYCDRQQRAVVMIFGELFNTCCGFEVLTKARRLKLRIVFAQVIPHEFAVRLSQEAIKACPPLASDMPVSRQYEVAIAKYFQWPSYWQGPHLWGAGMTPFAESMVATKPLETIETPGASNLRSVKEVSGYHIQAADSTVGHVDDFLLERDTWAIRYLVVDTGNWLPGRKVLISPTWAGIIDWKRSRVTVGMPRKAIETSPTYDPEHGPPSRDEEMVLHRHYDFKPYWLEGL